MQKTIQDETDSILCSTKDEAKEVIEAIGGKYISDWEYLPHGKVRINLNCKMEDVEKGEL